jgi:hypothetical protein
MSCAAPALLDVDLTLLHGFHGHVEAIDTSFQLGKLKNSVLIRGGFHRAALADEVN